MTISFNIVTGITGNPKPGASESSPQKKYPPWQSAVRICP